MLGTPGNPKLKDNWDHANVRKGAIEIEQEIIRKQPDSRAIFRHAHKEQSFAMLKYRAPRGLAIIGFAGTLGLGWDAYQQSQTAWTMFNDPTLTGSVLTYMQTGMAFGSMTQATAQPGILRFSKWGVSKLAGIMFLPVTFGLEGLQFATDYHEYNLGRISQRDLYRRTASPAIIMIFTVGGGIVGGIIGIQAAGITAIPAAITGANIGAIAAIPIQFAAVYMLDWYYHEFDEHQRLDVNEAVEKCYEVENCPKEPDL